MVLDLSANKSPISLSVKLGYLPKHANMTETYSRLFPLGTARVTVYTAIVELSIALSPPIG